MKEAADKKMKPGNTNKKNSQKELEKLLAGIEAEKNEPRHRL